MNERQHQLDLFTTAKEQRRAERLRRIAELATSTHTTTAKHMFDDAGEREARRIAEESVAHPGAGSASTR